MKADKELTTAIVAEPVNEQEKKELENENKKERKKEERKLQVTPTMLKAFLNNPIILKYYIAEIELNEETKSILAFATAQAIVRQVALNI